MFQVTRSCKTEGCCKTHVEQAAQDGQHDGQSEDDREVDILELHSVWRKPALGRESRPREARTVVLWNTAAFVMVAACCKTGAARTRPAEEEPAIPAMRLVATKVIMSGLPS